MAKLLLNDQTFDLISSAERKGVRIHHESLKQFLENRKTREEFERRKKSLTNQEKENEDLIRSSMEVRLGQAEAKLYEVFKRNRQLEEQHHQEQVKLQKVRSSNKQKRCDNSGIPAGTLGAEETSGAASPGNSPAQH